jgi:tetratricopeptide (TPR) repeat protein
VSIRGLIFFSTSAFAQISGNDLARRAIEQRAVTQQAAGLPTDDRIRMYQRLAQARPDQPHYQNLLAAAFLQKVRETTDFSYLDRASRILEAVLARNGEDYEALRLCTEVELERHQFTQAADSARRLIAVAPNDSWNFGTLGDALIELGEYDQAADAYQRMVDIKPDLSSYNRAAYFRFLYGDTRGAIDIMKQAIAAGSPMPENIAWCQVELGHLYLKFGRLDDAERAYSTALQLFKNYHSALAGLGHVAKLRGKTRPAIEYYKNAQAGTPLPEYAAALHDLYLATGNKEEARKQMELIDVIDRLGQAAKERLNRNLAMIYADHDYKLGRALELARAELETRKDIYTWDALAWTLFKNGKPEEGRTAIEKALALHTPEPMFYMHALKIAGALGHTQEAEEYRRQALAFNPSFQENSF